MTDNGSTGLLSALAAVQAEAPTLPKDKTNPHFKSKYTGLDTIVEKIGPLLAQHGLVWSALPTGTHAEPTLSYRLAHVATGEVLEGVMPLLLDKPTAQGLGSALTYARRYSLCSVLNLVTDEDDDGNAAGKGDTAADPKLASPSDRRSIYEAASGKVLGVELLNIVRAAKGDTPLEIPEEEAIRRLDSEITSLPAAAVKVVLKKVAA